MKTKKYDTVRLRQGRIGDIFIYPRYEFTLKILNPEGRLSEPVLTFWDMIRSQGL